MGMISFMEISPQKYVPQKDFKFIYPTASDKENHYRLYPWATDGCFYYYKNNKIPSDDYHNVQVFKDTRGVAKDKSWFYFLDKRINFNQKGEKLFDVDVASFTYQDPYVDGGKDKFGCINAREGRMKCE